MRRNRWLLILGIGVPLLACLYLAMCGTVGFVIGRVNSPNAGAIDSPVSVDPTPVVTPVFREPEALERETARILADAPLPSRDLVDLAHRLQGMPRSVAVSTPDAAPVFAVGNTKTFLVHNVQTNSYYTSTATLGYETPHAYWWIEVGYEIPKRDLERSALAFEEKTYPTSRRYFGSEWTPGIDGDPHVYIFLGDVPGVGGYFSGPDEYPTAVRPQSNEHEMFYINLENAAPGGGYFDGILAHEFQHMIHWAQDRDESSWVNEGLSELSAQVSGYDVGGSDYVYLQTPDTQLTTWSDLEDSGPHYGASYLFLAYFLQQYGEEAVSQLVREPANEIAGFEAILAEHDPGRRFKDLFADWVVANYLDDPTLAEGQFGYRDLDLSALTLASRHDTYPVRQHTTVHQYSADHILLEGEGDLTVEFTGTQVVPLVGNQAHSGQYQWWSNRGDEGDTRLTRSFDLSGLDSATLEVWMWYDLELDYDYAYVAVSTNGGDTWDLLASENTTTTNPSGNSYGSGFTGFSGGGDSAIWSLESFDLTPYAGQQVEIRFEMVTDEAVNRPGLVIDDISIPEIGYSYDVEDGQDGWHAEGWVRATDHLSQEFLVQAILFGDETRIERMTLDEHMRGTLRLAGIGQDVDHAVLVISAFAPATTEWASYSYQITAD